MRIFSANTTALAMVVSLLAGCNAGSDRGLPDVKNPVATVNSYKVSPEIMDVYAEARTRQKFEALAPEQKQEVLDEALKLIAIAEDARAKGLHKDPEVSARIELQAMNVLAQTRIGELVENASLDEAALQEAYQQQYVDAPKKEFKARHILVATEEEAAGVIEELEGGADFAELAKSKSIGPSAENGGDLGWFARDAMVKPFADAVATMESGAFSKVPVQTQFGFHVILSEGSRMAPPPAFESVQESLKASAQQKLVESYIESTRAAANVRVLADMGASAPAEAAEPTPTPSAEKDGDTGE